MSLTTLLLALVPTVFQPKRAAGPKTAAELIFDNADLRAERDALRAEVERVLRRNEELVLERDRARMRLDHQSRVLDGMIQARLNDPQQSGAAQLAQQQAGVAHAQMLQAMNAQLNAWGHCTCVPARHDMLLGALGRIL